MAYAQEITVGGIVPEGSFAYTSQVITSAACVFGVYTAHVPFVMQRLSFKVATAVNNLTSAVLVANVVKGLQNATPTTAAICTMTIPNGATAGSVFWNTCTPTLIPVGCQLQIGIKTQGGQGGTPAGAGYFGYYGTLSPEVVANETATTVILVTA
jgi:hypothetical protein